MTIDSKLRNVRGSVLLGYTFFTVLFASLDGTFFLLSAVSHPMLDKVADSILYFSHEPLPLSMTNETPSPPSS